MGRENTMNETNRLAAFIAETDFEAVPDATVEQATRCIRDGVGVSLAAASLDIGDPITEYVQMVTPGAAATIIGGGTASVEGAALANGFLCHALDWDDVTAEQYTHLTTGTLPAVLAAAESVDATGPEFLCGYLVGTQVHYRIAAAVNPSHYMHGWHTTGTAGTFGAAAAVASICDLSRREIVHALGLAGSCSSALRKQFGSMAKPYHAGHSAQLGLRAALLARAGFTADDAIFEGRLGYGTVMTPGEYRPAELLEPLADGWDIHDVGFKPFPGETIAHGAERAIASRIEREGIGPADIATIRVTLDDIGHELFLHEQPTNAFQSLYSIEFPLAAMVLAGEHGIDQFDDEFVRHPETQSLMARVERDFGFEDDDYDWSSARVTIETTAGSTFVEEERYTPKAIEESELAAKFRETAGAVLGDEDIKRLEDEIGGLPATERLDAFFDLLGAADIDQ